MGMLSLLCNVLTLVHHSDFVVISSFFRVYLIRESSTVIGSYVLTMFAYGTFRNFQIQRVSSLLCWRMDCPSASSTSVVMTCYKTTYIHTYVHIL